MITISSSWHHYLHRHLNQHLYRHRHHHHERTGYTMDIIIIAVIAVIQYKTKGNKTKLKWGNIYKHKPRICTHYTALHCTPYTLHHTCNTHCRSGPWYSSHEVPQGHHLPACPEPHAVLSRRQTHEVVRTLRHEYRDMNRNMNRNVNMNNMNMNMIIKMNMNRNMIVNCINECENEYAWMWMRTWVWICIVYIQPLI